jgi:Concanavalin A-like lectin/glucanases superfamily/PEP-CTERM motif
VSDGLGGLQNSIPAIPLSSYSFTDAFIGRSPFDADNATTGTVDEFRIYNEARSANQISADFHAGPNALVPEPASLALIVIGAVAMLVSAKRRFRS